MKILLAILILCLFSCSNKYYVKDPLVYVTSGGMAMGCGDCDSMILYTDNVFTPEIVDTMIVYRDTVITRPFIQKQ